MFENLQINRSSSQGLPLQFAEQLKLMIRSGYFKAADKLPSGAAIAKKTGLGYTTVDTALQILSSEGVLERTRRGTFVKASFAASLNGNAIRRIGVLFWTNEEMNSLYKRKALEGIGETLQAGGAEPVLISIEELKRASPDWWDFLAASTEYAGFIIDKEMTYTQEVLKLDRLCAVPMVYFNSIVDTHIGKRLFILPDFHEGMMKILTHLDELGHRRIALFKRTEDGRPDRVKEIAFSSFVLENPEGNIQVVGETRTTIEAAVDRVLAGAVRPTAIICATDIIAFHAIHHLQSRGLAVPGDMSVTGFNGFDIAEVNDPPITTVKVGIREMGRLVAAKMLEELAGIRHTQLINLPVELVVRGSTAKTN